MESQRPSVLLDIAPRHVCSILSSVAAGLLLIALILGAAGPPTFDQDTTYAYECEDGSHVWDPTKCRGWNLGSNRTVWKGQIVNVNALNQFWNLAMQIGNPSKEERSLEDFRVKVDVLARMQKDMPWEEVVMDDILTVLVECVKGEEWCDGIVVVNDVALDFPDYEVTVNFPDVNSELAWIGDVAFTFTVVNPSFATLALVLRVFAFAVACVVLILLIRRLGGLSRRSVSQWTREQTLLAILLVSLALFCNPVLPFDYAVHNWFVAALATACDVFYSVMLMLFLLCFFDLMRAPDGAMLPANQFYPLKLLPVGIIFIVQTGVIYAINLNLKRNPVDSPEDDVLRAFLVVAAVLHLLVLVWVLTLVVLAGQAVRWGTRLAQHRYAFAAVPTVLLIVCMIAGRLAAVAPGRAGRSALEFMFFFVLHNVFVHTLIVGFWPVDERTYGATVSEGDSIVGVGDINQRYASKDNPFA